MKIIYIHQYFKEPSEPGGTRSYWISRELIKRGHEVIMITGTSTKHNESTIENIDGIEVHYIKNAYSNNMGAGGRIKSFLKFVIKAIQEGKKQKNIDLVFATSTPLTTGAIALALKFTKGWKYVFEVRDLWPDALIQAGVNNKLAIWMLRKLEKYSYKYAEHVISLSPGMEEGVLRRGTPKDKSTMVPNMSKPDEFYPHERSQDIIDKFGIDTSKFNVIHFGSMGILNGLEYIINAAKYAQANHYDDINFIFLGAGSTESNLRELAKEYNLTNVQFLGNHPMKIVAEIVNCCDASITTFKNFPILRTNSPNKLFDSLSAGKPIIVNSAGWTKELVEKENCGFFADPENPADLIEKINFFYKDKELIKQWCDNARRLSLEVFDKSILSAKVADVLESAI